MPYDLFDKPYTLEFGTVTPPNFANIKEIYQGNLAKISRYYHAKKTFVPNEHILVKLLLTITASLKRDNQSYVDTVIDSIPRLCGHFKFSSPASYGDVYPKGYFYNENIPEVYVSDERSFDIEKAKQYWRLLQPIRVLRHPFTDLNLGRLDGKYKSDELGLAVISINIPMLAFQYKMWCETEQQKSKEQPSNRTHHFVSMYPITNAMYSHLDWCIFNRLGASYWDKPKAPYAHRHPFTLINAAASMDDILDKEVNTLARKPLTFDQMLVSIPTITARDVHRLARLPYGAPTRQFKWSLTLARLPLIQFLVQLNYDTDNPKNKEYLNRLRIQLRSMRQDKTLSHILPEGLYKDIELFILKEIESYI